MNPKRYPTGLNPYTQARRNQGAYSSGHQEEAAYESFGARELYCPKCTRSMPVRERLLLVLPSGELYEYNCVKCHSSLGTRKT